MRTLALVTLVAAACAAQTITGSIIGNVKDASGATVVGASVSLTHAGTGAVRKALTDSLGAFLFGSVQPGEWTLSATQTGFKTTTVQNVNLTAAEILSVGDILLEVGTAGESVTVEARGTPVQTASSERSGVVTTSQVENLLVLNRKVTGLLELLPGVVNRANEDSLNRTFGNLNVNGARNDSINFTMDGMTLNAAGNNTNGVVALSMDAVAEVKVLLSNFQAEYGVMSGANVQIVTKSGTREFHGLASYFKRHEQFNANEFFNNRFGLPKPRYRYNTWNYNVGGPVYIPGKWNRDKEKLFFFWSQEFWPIETTRPIQQVTVPTLLERQGNFSQSRDLNGALIPVLDPNTRQPFPGNIVPADRIDRSGQALLNFFPEPNLDPNLAGGRNYVYQNTIKSPQRTSTLKMDYNIRSTDLLSVNMTRYLDSQTGSVGVQSGASNWPQLSKTIDNKGLAVISRYQRIFSPTLINELNVSFSRRPSTITPDDADLQRNLRQTAGFVAPQLTASSNPLGLIPNATFGGVPGAANLVIEGRFPAGGTHDTFAVANNITKTWSRHTIKAGLYVDRISTINPNPVPFNGSFDFGRNVNNPLDTGYAFSNAFLGVFNSYTETTARPTPEFRLGSTEWFVQDNLKATKRLTLDVGLRFVYIPPAYEASGILSGFDPGRFDRSRAVRLIEPRLIDGRRAGVNPVNGQVFPATQIGLIAPGSGDIANGLVSPSTDASVPRGLVNGNGVELAPRFGFAYDPFGKGHTAIRGGFGVFYNRQSLLGSIFNMTSQRPLVTNPVVNFGTIATLPQSTGLLSPENIIGLDRNAHTPTIMNFSFGVQQSVGAGTTVDLSYVGSLGRNLMWQRNLNAIPFGTTFESAAIDPTNRAVLPPQFLRPFTGFNNINIREWASSSNYHSLQVTATRRFTRDLQFGLAWTWSKAMNFNDSDTDDVSTLIDPRVWNYGPAAFDRTHIVKINWLWDTPRFATSSRVLSQLVNGWQLSGIASFMSGPPVGVGFSTVTPVDITGSPTDGARVVVTGRAALPRSERTFSRYFDTSVYQMPARGTFGNAARTQFTGPGVNNQDIAIFKTFSVRESVKLQFRLEMYNAFNHTQFQGLDAGARFDARGAQVNPRFGEVISARDARRMQMALRVYF